jgi:hypothetical protein
VGVDGSLLVAAPPGLPGDRSLALGDSGIRQLDISLPLTEARGGGRCDTNHHNLSVTNVTQSTADRVASAKSSHCSALAQ